MLTFGALAVQHGIHFCQRSFKIGSDRAHVPVSGREGEDSGEVHSELSADLHAKRSLRSRRTAQHPVFTPIYPHASGIPFDKKASWDSIKDWARTRCESCQERARRLSFTRTSCGRLDGWREDVNSRRNEKGTLLTIL